jgi:hypothetical protein
LSSQIPSRFTEKIKASCSFLIWNLIFIWNYKYFSKNLSDRFRFL